MPKQKALSGTQKPAADLVLPAGFNFRPVMIGENEGPPDDQSARRVTRTSVLATLKNRKFIERQIENLDRIQ